LYEEEKRRTTALLFRFFIKLLDVWYRYPTTSGTVAPATQPFHELGNVIMTPHVSGWTQGMLEARAKLIAENIERIGRGEPPLNEIEPSA
jgi:phosphoglycerate dehydrogenase-like enzyme